MTAKYIQFSLHLNGEQEESVELPGHWRLLDYLHEVKGLTGTKYGCGGGMCKACTVAFVDTDGVHHAVPSCSTSLDTCNGWEVRTVEGLAISGELHPVQTALAEGEVFQCGYCTSGFLIEAFCLFENRKNGWGLSSSPTTAVRSVLESHLCRCTGYLPYLQAFTDLIERETPSLDDKPQVTPWNVIRWLHEAAEIENSLMLQYLYAAFSVKQPEYSSLAGQGHRTPGVPHSLLAIAIEEMMHLDTVNRLLVALGSRPNLVRQDFPYEPKIYPFEFKFEPLTKKSVAKYALAEAPPNLKATHPVLFKELNKAAECRTEINNIGSFYGHIRRELTVYAEGVNWEDHEKWDKELEHIQLEGEGDHFDFFVALFNGSHFTLPGTSSVWDDPSSDSYPSHQIDHQTMWNGHSNSMPEGDAKELAKLCNFHYWLTMAIFELSYVNGCQYHSIARRHMAGPLLQLCWHMPNQHDVLPPFDRSSLEYYAGADFKNQIDYILFLLSKIVNKEALFEHLLPAAYMISSRETQQEIHAMLSSLDKKDSQD